LFELPSYTNRSSSRIVRESGASRLLQWLATGSLRCRDPAIRVGNVASALLGQPVRMQATILRPHAEVPPIVKWTSCWIRKSTIHRSDLDRKLHAGLRCGMPDLQVGNPAGRARERGSTASESSAPKPILHFGKPDSQEARREQHLKPINRLMFLISSAVLRCTSHNTQR
jgi:hypothetical protein